jgi:MT0933-like antitoxin protein
MGFMDKVKGMLGQHSDKVTKGVDKAADMADSKTKGKYSDQIRTGTKKAKEQAEKMGKQGGGSADRGGDKGPHGGA